MRILGVVSHPLPVAMNDVTEWPDAMLVAAGVHEHNTAVRHFAAAASRSQQAEVVTWGADRSVGSDGVLVEHRLSAAAQAFKAQAMAAAGLTPLSSPIEIFRNRDSS